MCVVRSADPAPRQPRSRRSSDATSTIRDYWAADRQGHTPFTLEYDHLVGAPEGVEATPGIQIANAPQPLIVWGFGKVIGRVAAWNLFILLGIALSGICTFLLLDRFAFTPSHHYSARTHSGSAASSSRSRLRGARRAHAGVGAPTLAAHAPSDA